MESVRQFEVSERVAYNRESVAEAATQQAEALLREQLPELEDATTAERIEALRLLITEYAATYPGSQVPLDNGRRHVVEALASRLKIEEDRAAVETMTEQYPELVT